ncbi:N-acetylglucosamine kinase [Sinosporangium siamense]|uniref:N-acetylglucosamine kinase n=1 Tax=Sinosporangium siamense TaxID=1367973 RepID=A0A919RA37_9ACTN|nr:BadF/BadG/BcrA/BcrD ATPase family protein [Sinosporangium siamense]GII89812.1 N-acetylglucosamine kinase [Sinosporangium siamense]
MSLVLGVDAGGTTSRAVATSATGAVLGTGRAQGGNPAAHGIPLACTNITAAITAALGAADPRDVSALTVGLAGSSLLDQPDAYDAFASALTLIGLTATPRVLGDVVVAFAAGTAEPTGTVVLSGTGAICACITDHEQTAVADGLGWQLGDEGSGFWIGRAAAKATVRHLAKGNRPTGSLVGLVTRYLLGGAPHRERGASEVRRRSRRDLADLLVVTVQSNPPIALAELAPFVAQASLEGDPMAQAIVEEAADRLVATASEVRDTGDESPIVLAGSVLTNPGPFQDAVRAKLSGLWTCPVTTALDGAAAAAWLAAREAYTLTEPEAADLHATLVRPGSL